MASVTRKKRKKAMGEGWARRTGEKRDRRSAGSPYKSRKAESAMR